MEPDDPLNLEDEPTVKVTVRLSLEVYRLLVEHAMTTPHTIGDAAAILIEQALTPQADQG